MRCVLAILIVLVSLTLASAAPSRPGEFASPEAGLRWIYSYRAKPDPAAVPAMLRSLSQAGAFRDPESAGAYVGFLAGVLGSHPAKAQRMIDKLLSLSFADQWIVIRAIAYSGLPEWKDLMRALAVRLPARQVMIEQYLTGKLPTLDQVALEKKIPGMMETVQSYFTAEKDSGSEKRASREVTFESNPELIDVLWGIYFANGSYDPIARIVKLLPWSKDNDSVEKLTAGSMAKYTLASNASRDAALLAMLKRASPQQPEDVKPVLDEVIEAAETVETRRIRTEALAAVEELRRKGPGYKRDVAWWGKVGEGAISLGCLAAAVTGQVEFGLPCVVGGALSSAALRYLARPE
ncbi:MAG: hypothetical protein M3145_13405 [Pseudomonadota bacterium]|nr:hypothetical protein [Pseudomonadota bacterium]